MKIKLSLVSALALLWCSTSFSQTYINYGNGWFTNLLVFRGGGGVDAANSNLIKSGEITINAAIKPKITFVQSGSGPNPTLTNAIELRKKVSAPQLAVTENFKVDGDLDVVGTVSAGTIVWNLTNIIYSTNVCYPTNEQTTTVEMTLPYGLLEASTTLDFTAMTGTVNTQAQTAVIMVTNTSSPNVPFSIVPTMDGLHTQGTLRVSNVTACSFFRYGNKFTNMIALPLW